MAKKPRLKTRTREVDHGFKGIIKELKKLEYKPYVKIGYPEKSRDANKKHEREDGGESFVTVLDLAIFHEFGTVHSPERSFIRAAFDQNRKKIEKLTKKLLIKIYSNKITVEKSLDILGETILNDIKTFLKNDDVTPTSNRALDDNGSTLVDTGQLLNALTYKVVMRP